MNCVSSGKWNWANDHSELKYFGKTPGKVSEKLDRLDVQEEKTIRPFPLHNVKENHSRKVQRYELGRVKFLAQYLADAKGMPPSAGRNISPWAKRPVGWAGLIFKGWSSFGLALDMMYIGMDWPSPAKHFNLLSISSLYIQTIFSWIIWVWDDTSSELWPFSLIFEV